MSGKVVTLTQNGGGGQCTVLPKHELGSVPLYEIYYEGSEFPLYGYQRLLDDVTVTRKVLVGYMYQKKQKGCIPVEQVWDCNFTGKPEGWVLPADPCSKGVVLLKSYLSEGRLDHAVVATPAGEQDMLLTLGDTKHQYCYVGSLGSIEVYQVPGTEPLFRMWHGEYMDTKLVSEKNAEHATKNKYAKVRLEGYIYSAPREGTHPLTSFWNANRKDSAVAVAQDDITALLESGYTNEGIQGYVYL